MGRRRGELKGEEAPGAQVVRPVWHLQGPGGACNSPAGAAGGAKQGSTEAGSHVRHGEWEQEVRQHAAHNEHKPFHPSLWQARG